MCMMICIRFELDAGRESKFRDKYSNYKNAIEYYYLPALQNGHVKVVSSVGRFFLGAAFVVLFFFAISIQLF